MIKIYFLFALFLLSTFFSIGFTKGPSIEQRRQDANLARLESYRSDCLIKHSGDQRFCRKKVLKQCRDSFEKRKCLELMSKLPKSKIPRTNGPGLI